MAAHVIRLRGPWHYEPLARTALAGNGKTVVEPGELPPAGRTHLPNDWGESLGRDFRGRVRYTRHFNRPTGLDGSQHVCLVVEQVDALGHVSLNGELLGEVSAPTSARFDVTHRLARHNELVIEVELPRVTGQCSVLARPAGREDQPGGLVGEVRLEIDRQSGL
jgi:hypothetical protein